MSRSGSGRRSNKALHRSGAAPADERCRSRSESTREKHKQLKELEMVDFGPLDPKKRAEEAKRKAEEAKRRAEKEAKKAAERAKKELERQRKEIEKATGLDLPNSPAETLVDSQAAVLGGKSIDESLSNAAQQIATDVGQAVSVGQVADRLAIQIGEEALGDVGRIIVQSVHGPKMLSELLALEVLDQIVGNNTEGFSPEFLESPQGKTAVALALSITWSRDYYLSLKGTVPLPASVKELMKNGFGIALLDSVRIAESDSFDLALPGSINSGQKFFSGHDHAVTLDNVIVFNKIPGDQEGQLEWWAHELYHVKQYGDWGIAGFAKSYVEDWDGVEKEAREEAAKVVELIRVVEQFRLNQR